MVIVRRNEETREDVKLDVVDFVMDHGREYDIVLKGRDHSVTSYVDGVLVNRLTLAGAPRVPLAWLSGEATRSFGSATRRSGTTTSDSRNTH